MGRKRQLTDFIQKERATIGTFKPPSALVAGAGKASFLVPEKFGIDQLLRHRATVHPQDGAMCTG